MCGIVGYWHGAKHNDRLISVMADRLRHRGPDDYGVWINHVAGIALGHRRLAILDLSTAGRQPMHSVCGQYVIVYNGEVYNYQEIREDLVDLGHEFKGSSDTEVVLAAIVQWGLHGALKRFVGMFSFALWDTKERKLFLVRDRLGIKPLFYGKVGKAFVFASELKPFSVFPGFSGRIDRCALGLFLRYNYVPAPFSIYEDIKKVMPGQIVKVSEVGERIETEQYWSAVDVALAGCDNPLRESDANEAAEILHGLLSEAVKCRMVADVPLGAFLSGGVDSSTVVALMQSHSSVPVKTFSIGNTYADYDEANDAAKVADYLGTDHTELYVTPEQAMEVIPKLPVIYDEPFADSSQIPTFIVSELAREQVTVALSGDGGDELFAGYNRHVWAPVIWRRMKRYPLAARCGIAKLLEVLSPNQWDAIFAFISKACPTGLSQRMPGYKIQKLAEVLRAASPEQMYVVLTSHWQNPSYLVVGLEEDVSQRLPFSLRDVPDFSDFIRLADLLTYLPNDILTKVDRASMAVSLEARVPFLDHRVVKFAWRLPLSMKIRDGQGKWLLRQVLYKYVPKELVDRPKSGFGVPIEHWLRGPLREWAEGLIDPARLNSEGFFYVKPILQKWREHLAGNRNWAYLLWNILMFQAWLEEYS